jgi:hypothetical protein
MIAWRSPRPSTCLPRSGLSDQSAILSMRPPPFEHADANIFSVEPSGSAPILSKRRPEARLTRTRGQDISLGPSFAIWIVVNTAQHQKDAAIGNIIMIWTNCRARKQRPIVSCATSICLLCLFALFWVQIIKVNSPSGEATNQL